MALWTGVQFRVWKLPDLLSSNLTRYWLDPLTRLE